MASPVCQTCAVTPLSSSIRSVCGLTPSRSWKPFESTTAVAPRWSSSSTSAGWMPGWWRVPVSFQSQVLAPPGKSLAFVYRGHAPIPRTVLGGKHRLVGAARHETREEAENKSSVHPGCAAPGRANLYTAPLDMGSPDLLGAKKSAVLRPIWAILFRILHPNFREHPFHGVRCRSCAAPG